MTWTRVLIAMLILGGCRGGETLQGPNTGQETGPDTLMQTGTNQATAAPTGPTPLEPLPEPATPTRRPRGVYQGVLPTDAGRVEQTVQFFSNGNFHLQERYLDKTDSVVLADGFWSPSDGKIWLYQHEVLRGRYTWLGDTLAWVGVSAKRNIPMRFFPDAEQTPAWRARRAEGLTLFGIGNEPFWNVSVKDSISFRLADWQAPVTLPLDSAYLQQRTRVFTAGRDTLQLRVLVTPYYCSDGMSDHLYRNQVRVEYRRQVYAGCGVLFRKP